MAALRSAQIESPYEAFSTFAPECMVPPRVRIAAPTWKLLYGAYARLAAARAASITVSRSKAPPFTKLKGGRRDEDPDHGPHNHLVDAVKTALDAALAHEQGHEERDHGYEPGVGSRTTLDGYEARGDPPCEGDRRVPGRHPAGEGVRGVGKGLAEKDDEHDHAERDEREVGRLAPYALQGRQGERPEIVRQDEITDEHGPDAGDQDGPRRDVLGELGQRMVLLRGKVDDELHGRVEQLGHEDQEYGQNQDREL